MIAFIQPKLTKTTILLATLSIIVGASKVLFKVIEWEMMEVLGPFLVAPIFWWIWLTFVILIFASIIHFIHQLGEKRPLTILPLLINIIFILILRNVPFTEIWLDRQYEQNIEGYKQVVALIETGDITIPEDGYGLMLLPENYQHLSRGGGEIIIENREGILQVFFFTYRGILDSFSGYTYRSDDLPPQDGDFGGFWDQIIPQEPHWFFVASS